MTTETLALTTADVRRGDRIKMPSGEWATVATNAVQNVHNRVGTVNRVGFDIRYDDGRCHRVSGLANVEVVVVRRTAARA